MRLAIYGRPSPQNLSEEVKDFFVQLDNLKANYLVHEDFCNYLRQLVPIAPHVKTFTGELAKGSVDYLISLGGDGTLLETIPFVARQEIPVMGINTGKLGFLSNVPKENFLPAIVALKEKKFTIQNRSLLQLETTAGLFGKNRYALNELCLQRNDSSTMITIHAYLNGEFLNSYWADGLIIATPTGSTAYSLSCSGPILLPDSTNFVITPVSPHNLNVRPVIIPDHYRLKLRAEGRSSSFIVTLDSRMEVMESSVELNISKAQFGIKLIQLQEQSFLQTLRNKLHWGMDVRNEPEQP
jgi:NAD+ kinase